MKSEILYLCLKIDFGVTHVTSLRQTKSETLEL